MARPLRIEYPGATYHVTSRGNEQRATFRCNEDRETFLRFLAEAISRFNWSVTAWVLMTNHFHLVVQTPQPNLSRGMHWLLGCYAGWFNRRHKRRGHLFQGRFDSIVIEKETYFRNVLRYVVLNPVRAGMVERPEDYRWSSYRATAGLENATADWFDLASALEPFGLSNDPIAYAAYRQFVLDSIGMDDPLWEDIRNGIFLGSEAWAKEMRRLVEAKPRATDFPKKQRAVGRPNMHAVVSAVARCASVAESSIRHGRGHPLRALVAWIGWNEGLHTLRTIAASLRLRSEGHISNLVRRCEAALTGNAELLRLFDASLAALRA